MEIQPRKMTEQPVVIAPDGSEIREMSRIEAGSVAHCTLPVRGISLAIKHKTINEIWFILSGKGEVWRSGENFDAIAEVEQGTSLSIPVGTHFQFRNTGDVPLCFLIATFPCWSGDDEAERVPDHWAVSA